MQHLFLNSRPSSVPSSKPWQRRVACWTGVLVLALCLSHPAHALDANQASASELEALRGLGPKTAALIVKERARGGPYESLDNLAERVKGIGAKKTRMLEASGLRVGGTVAVPRGAKSGTLPATVRARRPVQPPAARQGGL